MATNVEILGQLKERVGEQAAKFMKKDEEGEIHSFDTDSYIAGMTWLLTWAEYYLKYDEEHKKEPSS